jgi:hypothetical protein
VIRRLACSHLVAALVPFLCVAGVHPARAQSNDGKQYAVLATNKTSTMQKEMTEAASTGFRFVSTMGGETAFGGSEVVVLMARGNDAKARYEYRLLATSKTGTMQKELQQASDAGYDFVGQTVFKSTFGGREVVVLLERDRDAGARPHYEFKLLATSKTSTLGKELREAAEQGYEVVGMTVGETLMGGSELVTITRRKAR